MSTYCDKGHIYDVCKDERCHECRSQENEQALRLIEEIEDMLVQQYPKRIWRNLQLLKEILTD